MENNRTRGHPVLDFLKFHLLTRLVSVADKEVHGKKLASCLASTTIYAVAYGIYEYFIVYKGLMGRVLDEETNWAIMIGGLVVVVLVSTWSNVEMCVMSLLYLFLMEDLTYWTCQGIELGTYPFPAGDWFDSYFASFRVLGGIGQAIPFWPYVPFFYIPGYAAIIAYYVASWRSAKAGRVVAWIVGPFFIAIIAGTLVTEEIATGLLITIPSASSALAVLALAINRHGTRPRD
nr:hypothetical protein [Candidatus Sigynarchaeum springense]